MPKLSWAEGCVLWGTCFTVLLVVGLFVPDGPGWYESGPRQPSWFSLWVISWLGPFAIFLGASMGGLSVFGFDDSGENIATVPEPKGKTARWRVQDCPDCKKPNVMGTCRCGQSFVFDPSQDSTLKLIGDDVRKSLAAEGEAQELVDKWNAAPDHSLRQRLMCEQCAFRVARIVQGQNYDFECVHCGSTAMKAVAEDS